MKKLSEWANNNRQFFSNKRIFYSVILLTFFSRLLIAVQPIEYIDGLLIHDDTYYLLTIAKNIAMGNGPFISDNFTNGFQPLFTFIIVPIFFLFPNDLIAPLNAALIISALFESITLAFFLKILAMYSKSGWTLIAAALIWISNSYIILNSLNGLETALSVLLIVLTLYYFLKLREQEAISRKQFFILGIFAGFAALARVDNFLLLVSILAVITFEPYFNKVRKFYFKNALCILAGTAIIYLPWLVYSYAYTGDFFQISGKALRLYTIFAKSDPNSSNIIGIIIAIKEVLLYNKKLVLAGSVTLLILFFVLRKKAAVNEVKEMMGLGLSLLSLFSLLLVISYGLYYYAFWFYGRYLYAIFLFFIFLFLFGLDRIIYTGKKWLMVYTVVIVSFMLITNIVSRSFYSFYISQQTRNFSLMVIANWVKDKMPPGSVIGSTQSGALEYFANNQKIINLDGVVNKAFYQSCQRKKAIEYIREKNIEYIIDWDSNINYFKYFSSNFKETDLKDIKTIEGFKSWGNCWHVYKVNY